MATHSVEIINRLGPPAGDAMLLAIDRAESQATRLDSESDVIKELRGWCDLSPFASLNLLRSRRVLFHEGKSDADILDACARLYFQNDPKRMDQYKQWTKVPLDDTPNAAAKDLLEKALEPILAQDQGEPMYVVRVLDRDCHRQEQMGPAVKKPQSNIISFNVTWARHSIESLFLDGACLSEWIWYALMVKSLPQGVDKVQLKGWTEDALLAANQDEELHKNAYEQLLPLHLRCLSLSKALSDKEVIHAVREAERQAKDQPEIYQQGHARAKFVLTKVRERLPISLQKYVRGNIADIIKGTKVESVLSVDILVPQEIRQLLTYLTSDKVTNGS